MRAAGRLGLARLRLARAEMDLFLQDVLRTLILEIAAVGFVALCLVAAMTALVLALPGEMRPVALAAIAVLSAAGAWVCFRQAGQNWSRPPFLASFAEFERDIEALHDGCAAQSGESPIASDQRHAV